MPAEAVSLEDIRTPAVKPSLLNNRTLQELAARLGVRLLGRPFKVGNIVVVAQHAHVTEALKRDLDFLIAPINAKRINEVNGGPFVLGMDRGADLLVERDALYAALRTVDLDPAMTAAAALADEILAHAGAGEFDVVGGFARKVAARTARSLFGLTEPPEDMLLEAARAIFGHTFLNLGDDPAARKRAVKAGAVMSGWFKAEIARRRAAADPGRDMMGALIRQGALDDDGVRRTLGGNFVGAIDTTATAVAKIVAVLGADHRLMSRAMDDLDDQARMRGWCYEALRRWPHNPLLLRQAARDTELAGVAIPAGARVALWTHAAMRDASAFPDPGAMRPDRPNGAYLHFGGQLHACAGRAVNDRQIPMLVSKLLKKGVASVGDVSWAGPFPDRLPVRFGGK